MLPPGSSHTNCMKPIRCSLLFCWLYVFHSRKNGKQRIPNSLIVSSSLTNESQSDENHHHGLALLCNSPTSVSTGGPYTVVIQPSYRDRFPLLPYQGPLIIRDPVESCADLEEVLFLIFSPSSHPGHARGPLRAANIES